MRSPKFGFIQQELDQVFEKSALREEWKKRVKYQIRKQIIFDPIEYRDIDEELSTLIDGIRLDILNGEYQVRRAKRFLIEKSVGLCRQMTVVHPRDLLVLERLSRTFHFELKNKSPSKSAFFEPDDGSFIKGFQQHDFQYGSYASWRRFQRMVFGFAAENKYIVITDVANFYDFINFQHLRNIISSLATVREAILDLLIYLLNRLTWTPDFMPLTQVGMPQIETTATRVLANALLFEVDRVCEKSATMNYARFMDDMDIGVESVADAKKVVRDIDLTLQSRQLRLNSSKTKILSQQAAYDHFRISENAQLSTFEKAASKTKWQSSIGAILVAKYEKWMSRDINNGPGGSSRFIGGNGSKIHKRILSLIYECGGSVPNTDLLWLIENDPGMRSTAIRYLAKSTKNNSAFHKIHSLLRSGIFVDDASVVEISYFLLHARFRKTEKLSTDVAAFIETITRHGDLQLHCGLFVASRFQTQEQILKLLKENVRRLSSDFWLSRGAAGVAPRFIGGPYWSEFIDVIRRLQSEEAESVVQYFKSLSEKGSLTPSLKAYLNAKNRTFPQQLYYPKILHLLAVSKNPHVATILPKLHATHPNLRSDPYYRSLGF